MEKALFVARCPYGREILSVELYLTDNIFDLAHKVMNAARADMKQEVYCCEVWTRPEHHTMNLLVTVF